MADVPYRQTGADARDGGTLDRIDRAIARIELAAAARTAGNAALAQRHEALRTSMAEAIAALDAVIARPGGDGATAENIGGDGG